MVSDASSVEMEKPCATGMKIRKNEEWKEEKYEEREEERDEGKDRGGKN